MSLSHTLPEFVRDLLAHPPRAGEGVHSYLFMASLKTSLKNVRHEKFAQCVASGLTGADGYRQVMNYKGKEADGNAANWPR